MVAAIRPRTRVRRGSGAAAPALLDTRAQVPSHVEIAASGRGEESRIPARRDFRPRPNPWTKPALKASTRAQEALARAYEDAGRELVAARVAFCGVPSVGFSQGPEVLVPLAGGAVLVLPPATPGELLRSSKGVPTAVATRCGSGLCARGCAGDCARRRRRVILDRLDELRFRADPRRPAPMYVRQPQNAAAVEELLQPVRIAMVQEHGSGAKLKKREKRPRRPRRPRRDRLYEVRELAGGTVAVELSKAPQRRTLDSFRVSLPPTTQAYGCRQLTLTQPKRGGCLDEQVERILDALTRFTEMQTFRAHCDAAVFRVEFELSTPARRRDTAKAQGRTEYTKRGTWWHVHVHGLVWGRFWAHSPSSHCKRVARVTDTECVRADGVTCTCEACDPPQPSPCMCTRCSGVDDEDSLLIAWRRALVETKRYGDELDALDIHQDTLLRRIRMHSHPSRRTWATPLLDVPLGGARIQIPSRVHGSRSLTPMGAVAEAVKYATKTIELGKMPRHRVAEVVEAMNGRRLMRCTGLLFNLHLPDDTLDEPAKTEIEGIDQDVGIGEHAFTPSGRVVEYDDIVWAADPWAFEMWRKTWCALHDKHEREKRAALLALATGPPPDAGGEAWTP
jgi:hypothetical protein